MGTVIIGTSPRSRTGEGRDLTWYSIGTAVPLIFIPPFFCSAASPHPPPTTASLSIAGQTASAPTVLIFFPSCLVKLREEKG